MYLVPIYYVTFPSKIKYIGRTPILNYLFAKPPASEKVKGS